MARRLLLLLPATAVAIVLWAVLTAGAPGAVEVAQVVGGPTLGTSSLSWRVRVVRLVDGQRTLVAGRPLRVRVSTPNGLAEWTGATDSEGQAEVRFELPEPLETAPLVSVEARDTGSVLAHGRPACSRECWAAGVQRQGGWLPGRSAGAIELRVAPADGALAVPFPARLLIEARRRAGGQEPLGGVEIAVDLAGAVRPTEAALETDAHGLAVLELHPLEHAIRLEATARSPAGGAGSLDGRWHGAVPVVPGALAASLDGSRLIVRSPIQRELAYVSLVSPVERLAGYSVPLVPAEEGTATGSVELAPRLLARLEAAPSYAVVSSEFDKRSPSAVGWPLSSAARDLALGPPRTFDAPDRWLLDGTAAAVALEREHRRVRRRLAALLVALTGAGMGVAFWREVRNRAQPSELSLSTLRWGLWLALACIALGVGALAWFGTLSR